MQSVYNSLFLENIYNKDIKIHHVKNKSYYRIPFHIIENVNLDYISYNYYDISTNSFLWKSLTGNFIKSFFEKRKIIQKKSNVFSVKDLFALIDNFNLLDIVIYSNNNIDNDTILLVKEFEELIHNCKFKNRLELFIFAVSDIISILLKLYEIELTINNKNSNFILNKKNSELNILKVIIDYIKADNSDSMYIYYDFINNLIEFLNSNFKTNILFENDCWITNDEKLNNYLNNYVIG